MANTGWGSQKSHLAGDAKRESVDGKNALLFEVIHQLDDGNGTLTIYKAGTTDYGSVTRSTTGAAILNDIKFIEWLGGTHINATTNTYSTTVSIGVFTANIINGPTTLAICQFHQKATGAYHRILVAGKTF